MASLSGPRREVIRVIFRYDDCSAKSSLELERRFVQAFANCGAQVTLGVIPFVCAGDEHDPSPQAALVLPPEKADFLRRAASSGHAEIALHGCYHQLWDAGRLTEFAGLPPQDQRRRMLKGRRELEARLGVALTTFIPPWNAYDGATLQAMEDTGLRCVSASLRGPFPQHSDIRFLPQSCWFQGLRDAVRAARALRHLRPVILVVLHDYEFVESGRTSGWLTLSDLSSTLEELVTEPDVRLCSIRQAHEQGLSLCPAMLVPHYRWRRCFRGLSWRFRQMLEDQVLWTRGVETRPPILLYCYQGYVSSCRVLRDAASVIRRRLKWICI